MVNIWVPWNAVSFLAEELLACQEGLRFRKFVRHDLTTGLHLGQSIVRCLINRLSY